MSTEAKREVWVVEWNGVPQGHESEEAADEERVSNFGDTPLAKSVRYVPAVEQACAVPAPAVEAWVPCEERMPESFTSGGPDDECWLQVFAPARGVDVAAWDGERWVWRHHGYAIPSEVTHWAPMLPPPPKEPR